MKVTYMECVYTGVFHIIYTRTKLINQPKPPQSQIK